MNQMISSSRLNAFYQSAEYLSPERELELFESIKKGNGKKAELALDIIVSSHMRLAQKYVFKFRHLVSSIIDHDDLLQEAAIGITLAAKKFEPMRGIRFATYAMYWIKMTVLAHINSTRYAVKVSLGNNTRLVFHSYHKVRRQIEAERKYPISEDEMLKLLSERLNVPINVLKPMTRLMDLDPMEMDATVYKDGSAATWGDTLEDGTDSIESIIIHEDEIAKNMEKVYEIVKEFTPREKEIFRHRLCCTEEDEVTLRELAETMGVSHERVRQLEVNLMKKLKVYLTTGRKIKRKIAYYEPV